ncbi:MAG: hypothetical protein Alpg2KO_17780 [Alphaproteobacteria bacterium]
MFARRTPMTLTQKALAWLWPRSGWRRGSRYILFRLKRLPGTPESIAAGVAIGVAVSFTPFFGLHLLIAAAIAWVLRANMMGALIGTAVGNPWTFPFFLWLEYRLGFLMLRMEPSDVPEDKFSFDGLLNMPQDELILLLLPTAVGGLMLSLAAYVVTYYPIRTLVRGYQKGRLERRMKALERKRARAEAKVDKLACKIAETARKQAVEQHRIQHEAEEAREAEQAREADQAGNTRSGDAQLALKASGSDG